MHFEVDLADPNREIPVDTTGEVAHRRRRSRIPATEIPLFAASVRGTKATVFVVDGDVAHAQTFAVKGEIGGSLFVDPALAAGTQIVTEGRALLSDGDRVSAKPEAEPDGRAERGARPMPVRPRRRTARRSITSDRPLAPQPDRDPDAVHRRSSSSRASSRRA